LNVFLVFSFSETSKRKEFRIYLSSEFQQISVYFAVFFSDDKGRKQISIAQIL